MRHHSGGVGFPSLNCPTSDVREGGQAGLRLEHGQRPSCMLTVHCRLSKTDTSARNVLSSDFSSGVETLGNSPDM